MRTFIMKRWLPYTLAGLIACTTWTGATDGRGFGGFRGGGGWGGGYHYGGFGGGWSGSRSGMYGGSYSGSRSFSGYSGYRSGWGSGSYDRSYTDARGGSISTSGSRSAYSGAFGAKGYSSNKTVTATTASGQTYSHTVDRGGVEGPGGRYVGGSSHYGSTSGPRGDYSNSWQSA